MIGIIGGVLRGRKIRVEKITNMVYLVRPAQHDQLGVLL